MTNWGKKGESLLNQSLRCLIFYDMSNKTKASGGSESNGSLLLKQHITKEYTSHVKIKDAY